MQRAKLSEQFVKYYQQTTYRMHDILAYHDSIDAWPLWQHFWPYETLTPAILTQATIQAQYAAELADSL
jgi:hypothetical protein